MSNPHTASSLQETIKNLESKRKEEGQQIKEQFHDLAESMKPVNLIKGAFHDFVKPEVAKQHFVIRVISLTSGFLFRKYFQTKTNNHFQNIVSAVAMSGVTYAVTSNPAPLLMVGKKVLSSVFRKHSEWVGK